MSKLWKLVYILVGIVLFAAIFPRSQKWAEHFADKCNAKGASGFKPKQTIEVNTLMGSGLNKDPNSCVDCTITGVVATNDKDNNKVPGSLKVGCKACKVDGKMNCDIKPYEFQIPDLTLKGNTIVPK